MSPNPKRSTLTPDRIVDVALGLVDHAGLDRFSMRKLGAALGVEAMALYHHFGSKDRLLAGIAERLDEEIAAAIEPTGDWLAALRAMARACHAVARRHPAAFALLAHSESGAKSYLHIVKEHLRDAGLDDVLAALVLHVVDCYATGAALGVRGQAATVPTGAAEEIFETGLALVLDRLRTLPTQILARAPRR